jgi:hypothetical protein
MLEHLRILVKFIQFCTSGACAQIFVGRKVFVGFGVLYKLWRHFGLEGFYKFV